MTAVMKKTLAQANDWRTGVDDLLSRVAPKNFQTFERQSEACENKLAGEQRARWHRFSRLLMALAPALPRSIGSNAMLFFIPDGPYRKQVFALHVRKDGTVAIYARDVLEQAREAGLLKKSVRGGAPDSYGLASGESLTITALDGKTPNQEPFYKDMTGWNRRAMCIMLPPTATDEQCDAAEALCAFSAAEWMA